MHTHHALTMHSPCTHHALTMHSPCTHHTPFKVPRSDGVHQVGGCARYVPPYTLIHHLVIYPHTPPPHTLSLTTPSYTFIHHPLIYPYTPSPHTSSLTLTHLSLIQPHTPPPHTPSYTLTHPHTPSTPSHTFIHPHTPSNTFIHAHTLAHNTRCGLGGIMHLTKAQQKQHTAAARQP
jgi:hypothetical protein